MTFEQQETLQRARTARMGMWLFLAALGMLFAASLLGYLLIRSRATASLTLPPLLYLSTAIILLSSVTMWRASRAAGTQAGHTGRWLVATLVLAVAFVAVQVPALWQLLAEHRTMQSAGVGLYGLVFFLILLHGLHVIGGVAALARAASRSAASPTGADPSSIRLVTMYWHFLDAVWVVMFAVLLLAG